MTKEPTHSPRGFISFMKKKERYLNKSVASFVDY